MAMLNIEAKDEKILALTSELNALKASKGPVLLNPNIVQMEEQIEFLRL
jgi:hypothetical protein